VSDPIADGGAARRPIDPAEVRRILVRSTNWIGDVVMISPALRALRAGFPAARLDVLARAGVAGAFAAHPLVDEVVTEERRSGSGRHGGLTGALRLARELRRRDYDLAVILPKSIAAALAPALARIPRRVGYATAGRGPLLTLRVPVPPGADAIHHADFFLGPARFLGCPDGDRALAFPVPEEDRQAAERFLREAGVRRRRDDGHPLVAIHPGASRPERAWAAERFGELARRLTEGGARVLVLGGPRDLGAAARVLASAGPGAVNGARLDSLARMAALVSCCDLFIGNDSGPAHVAAAVGTPTVAVFGPGVPWKTAPYVPASRRREATRHFPCAPCRQDFFRECDPAPSGKPWCLEAVSVDEVFAAAADLLLA
jgi:heptosyltransferase-2